jgi:preprotein translocase subunit SecE
MKAVFNYFKESWQELGKITWPSREQSIKLTAAVIVFSIVLAGFMGGVDFGLNRLVQRVILKQ